MKPHEEPTLNIGPYLLRLTCSSCPEQYDVFDGDEMVGYLRLRHGYFTAQVPDAGGVDVYEAHPKGDGGFYEDERQKYLEEACAAIQKYYSENDL